MAISNLYSFQNDKNGVFYDNIHVELISFTGSKMFTLDDPFKYNFNDVKKYFSSL